MLDITCPLCYLVNSIHSHIIVDLKVGVLPTANDRLMIGEDSEISTIDLIDEMTYSKLDSQ